MKLVARARLTSLCTLVRACSGAIPQIILVACEHLRTRITVHTGEGMHWGVSDLLNTTGSALT